MVNIPCHAVRNWTENPLHHRQMLAIVVRLEQRNAQVQLEHDAAIKERT